MLYDLYIAQEHKNIRNFSIHFAGNPAGQKVFARIVTPSEIELCSETDLDEVQVAGGKNLQQIRLS